MAFNIKLFEQKTAHVHTRHYLDTLPKQLEVTTVHRQIDIPDTVYKYRVTSEPNQTNIHNRPTGTITLYHIPAQRFRTRVQVIALYNKIKQVANYPIDDNQMTTIFNTITSGQSYDLPVILLDDFSKTLTRTRV